jgi:hypothetical protein
MLNLFFTQFGPRWILLEYGPNCFVARWASIFIYIFICNGQKKEEREYNIF